MTKLHNLTLKYINNLGDSEYCAQKENLIRFSTRKNKFEKKKLNFFNKI